MTFKYFKADFTTTIEEAKRQYRRLAMKFHPDMGGDLNAMQAINAEWDYLRKHNYNIHEAQNGATYTDETQDAPDNITNDFAEIIEQLIKMQGVEIEICGKFLWLSGNTYDYKAEIKAMGFRWASKKRMWFLAPEGWRKKSHRELTMGEIRETYGSQRVTAAHRMALTA